MHRFTLEISTAGDGEIVNLSPLIVEKIKNLQGDLLVNVFAVGSTAAVTTLEYEPGLVKHDIPALLKRLAPDDARYVHEATWNDDNGHSHVRAALLGPSVTVPAADGALLTGEYQQIVLLEFDTRPRRRKVIVTVMGDDIPGATK